MSTARIAVVIPAAGLSSRFGRNKLLEPLAGEPVFTRTIRAFTELRDLAIAQIVIARAPGVDPRSLAPLVPDDSRILWTPGGPTRADSVRRAAEAVAADIDWLAVHDAARPLVSADLIACCITHAHTHGNAIPAMPVKLTVKEAHGPLPAVVKRTLTRGDLWEMQTPQVMRRTNLLAAFAKCPLPMEQITDDAQLLELAGETVWLIPGEERNLKITTPTDLHLAEAILAKLDPRLSC